MRDVDADSLTPTERKVVDLVGEGLTNREIGVRLYISPRTVDVHVSHVYQKLGINLRVALVVDRREQAALAPT